MKQEQSTFHQPPITGNKKRIPYGLSNYTEIREENRYYVDKTRYIEKIENSEKYLFFLRPRRFGKSLWLSVMENYYDMAKKDRFEELFNGTYIYNSPTPEKNSYLILKFNFSDVESEIKRVESSFCSTIKIASSEFIRKYEKNTEKADKICQHLEILPTASEVLKYLISYTKGKGKIYLLIDEYDNFTNTIISSIGKEQYMAITHGEGFYRHFFNVIKAGTGAGTISKIFITGVSPVTMDDVTSGFNIGSNITVRESFNELAGFTEEEVLNMLDYYNMPSNLIEVMRPWYNNYLFSKNIKIRLYNSDMVLYFIKEYLTINTLPEEMLDNNIRTDYNKLKYLIILNQQGKLRVNGNFDKIKTILEEGQIEANIVQSFSVQNIIDDQNFISLLYYLGLLTIKNIEQGMTNLIIPNEVIRRIYYEYIREAYKDTEIFKADIYKLSRLFKGVAFKGTIEELINYLAEELNKQTAVRDYIQGERVLQNFFRVYFNISNYYLIKSEYELNKGYGDIVMIPNLYQYPDMKYSYLIELKYIPKSKYKKLELNRKIKEAQEKLNQYREDKGLKELARGTDMVRLIIVFSGWEMKFVSCER